LNETRIKALIKVWWEKGTRETDKFSRFLFFWICFNAWLAYCSNKITDRQMINWLKSSSANRSDLSQTYQKLQTKKEFKTYLKSLSRLSPIYDPRGIYDPVNVRDENDFPNVVEAIYRIRCNLFHGSKEAHVARDQNLVQI
jgi:hypothetical protein